MSEVICLSDSDEESCVPAVRNDERNRHEEIDFSFPSVEFTYRTYKSINVKDCSDDNDVDKELLTIPSKNREESPKNDRAGCSRFSAMFEKYNIGQSHKSQSQSLSNESDDNYTQVIERRQKHKSKKKGSDSNSVENGKGKDNEQSQSSQETKAEKAARLKSLKALEKLNQKNIQPGECLKFMEVSVDDGLRSFNFYSDVVDVLKESGITYKTRTNLIPNSITWSRNVELNYINDSNGISTHKEKQIESQVIIIWTCEETVRRVKDGTFSSSVENVATILSDKQLTLVIYGMEEYFLFQKKIRHRTGSDDMSSNSGSKSTKGANSRITAFNNYPKISKGDLEFCLAEVQLTVNCNSRIVDTPQDLSLLVYQFTKAIAEIPFKSERWQKFAETVDWYAMGDKRDTVKIDKDGNGLKRLWRQQLCQFNLSTLETAEAIASEYLSPFQLIQAYAGCTPEEGEMLLKDIPIRRAAGPLSTIRKIGPELSKKMFIMFTSEDGETMLGND